MPRTLPWLAEAAKKKESKKKRSSSPAPKRKRASSPDELVDSDLNPIGSSPPQRREKSKRVERTPSTSPPPAPPDVEYMREGYNADDIYMLVEDEFLSTAKMFTQHIHHAEYVRLKKLARSRGAGTLQAIDRPVDGRTEQSAGLRVRLETEEKARNMKDGLVKVRNEGESSEEDDYMLDPQLAGLMTRAKGVGKDLSGITKAKSNTRAAAGFSQSPRNVERRRDALVHRNEPDSKPAAISRNASKAFEDEVFSADAESDLDAPPTKPTWPTYGKAEKRRPAPNGYQEKQPKLEAKSTSESSGMFKRFAQPSQADCFGENRNIDDDLPTIQRKDKPSGSADKTVAISPSKKAGSTSRDSQSTAASDYLTKRKANKERREREEERKSKQTFEVPTFLF